MALYSDINKYTPRQSARIEDIDAVFASVHNLLTTPPRQRLFRPEGLVIEDLLFENMDDNAVLKVRNHIYNVLQKEPRIELLYNQLEIIPVPEDYVFKIKMRFRVKGLEGQIFERVGSFRRSSS